jgi:hypothetical protein
LVRAKSVYLHFKTFFCLCDTIQSKLVDAADLLIGPLVSADEVIRVEVCGIFPPHYSQGPRTFFFAALNAKK